jgi:Domain of unknown function (DUF222)/HNH endonuclease
MSEGVVLPDDGREPLPYVPTLLDAAVAPDDVAAWAASVTPGSAVVTPLTVLDPARLSYAGRIDALAALDKHISWIQAQQHRLLAVMAADPAVSTPAGELDKQWVREDVACALRLSAVTATDRLELATALTRLPATLDLLERGEITTHHARHLAQTVLCLDDATATVIETVVLGKAPEQVLATFKRAVRRALLRAAPQRAEQRHQEAMTQRRVVRTPDADGMSAIWMLLPDTGAATFMTAIDALACRVQADDPRTADQRRADAAIQLALDALTGTSSGALPREHGMRPSVQVTVALSTLLGLDEQPGDLDGSGPIPATLARRIAADPSGTWRRLVTDEMGRLLDYGRNTYRPPKDLTEHVIARDRTCRFPNCNRKAGRCEIDHRQPWEQGGTTNQANLDALCSRHHHGKHQAGWRPKRQPDGTIEWTSPTGHKYTEEAATYPIDQTAEYTADRTSEADPDPPPY